MEWIAGTIVLDCQVKFSGPGAYQSRAEGSGMALVPLGNLAVEFDPHMFFSLPHHDHIIGVFILKSNRRLLFIKLCASFERGNEKRRLYCSSLHRVECSLGTDKALHRGSCGRKKWEDVVQKEVESSLKALCWSLMLNKQPLQKVAKSKAIPNQGKIQISFCCKLSWTSNSTNSASLPQNQRLPGSLYTNQGPKILHLAQTIEMNFSIWHAVDKYQIRIPNSTNLNCLYFRKKGFQTTKQSNKQLITQISKNLRVFYTWHYRVLTFKKKSHKFLWRNQVSRSLRGCSVTTIPWLKLLSIFWC